MRKFVKPLIIALFIGFAVCVQAKTVMTRNGDVPKNASAKSESQIIVVGGQFNRYVSLGNGVYRIECKEAEDICFIINGDPGVWLKIEATNEEFEILDFHGVETEGDITSYSFSLKPLH